MSNECAWACGTAAAARGWPGALVPRDCTSQLGDLCEAQHPVRPAGYLSVLNATWLNESATLFRRRYYKNGSHAGFILYMTDAAHSQDDVDRLREAMKNTKGPGNFRNLFMYAPNGKKDGIQLFPVSEVAAKDEFWNIKNETRDDQLAAHRVPPQVSAHHHKKAEPHLSFADNASRRRSNASTPG
jgi:PBSX family phage portal protein